MTKPFDMELFLRGVLTGSNATRQRHIRQAQTVQTSILRRWQLDNPWRWQYKHITWFLDSHLKSRSPATRYYYILTILLISKRMRKDEFWTLKLRRRFK
nr:hypothetical protein [Pseudomonas protegens]